MRGEVDILLEEKKQSLARLKSGQVFGELAFLDGAARTASAIAVQPTILLVMHRNAFNELIQSEPHLGMMVLRNIALDLSSKLRLTNHQVAGPGL